MYIPQSYFNPKTRCSTSFQVQSLRFFLKRMPNNGSTAFLLEPSFSISINTIQRLSDKSAIDYLSAISEKGLENFNGYIIGDVKEELVVILFSGDNYTEFRCNSFLLKDDIGTFNGYHKALGTKSCVLYNFDNRSSKYIVSKIVPIDETVESIIVCTYFPPLSIALNPADGYQLEPIGFSLPQNPDFKSTVSENINHFNSYDHGYGVRSSSVSMEMYVSFLDLTVAFYSSIQVYSRTYEVISHSSMDPGPDERFEYTNWVIRGALKFTSLNELSEYISQINAHKIEKYPRWMINKFRFNHIFKYDCYPYRLPSSFKNLTDAEKSLSVNLYESWHGGS